MWHFIICSACFSLCSAHFNLCPSHSCCSILSSTNFNNLQQSFSSTGRSVLQKVPGLCYVSRCSFKELISVRRGQQAAVRVGGLGHGVVFADMENNWIVTQFANWTNVVKPVWRMFDPSGSDEAGEKRPSGWIWKVLIQLLFYYDWYFSGHQTLNLRNLSNKSCCPHIKSRIIDLWIVSSFFLRAVFHPPAPHDWDDFIYLKLVVILIWVFILSRGL